MKRWNWQGCIEMMSFSDERGILQVVGEVVRRAFDFRGRSRRLDGLLWYLIAISASEGSGLLVTDRFEGSSVLSVGLITLNILLLLPLAGWSVRRLHDINQSGWWALALLVPLFGLWSGRSEDTIALLWFVVWVMLLVWAPTEGENRFGPNPRSSLVEPS